MIWILLLALIGGAYALPFLIEQRRPEIDDDARVDAPGSFAELTQGVTHFQWLGGTRGPVAVCVHGLSTPSAVWHDFANELAQLGYRVLIYDLFGRGLSDRPEGKQDDAFFVQQLEDLLAHEQIGDDITLFGYSMGGVIATTYAAKHPDRIRQLVLVAPAGFGGFPTGLLHAIRDLGRAGDWLAQVVLPKRFKTRAGDFATENPTLAPVVHAQYAQTATRGFIPAIVSSLRYILRDAREHEHRKLSRVDVPVLAIWAAEDKVIPISGMGNLTKWNRIAVQTQIEGAGHWLPASHAKEVAAAFRDNRE